MNFVTSNFSEDEKHRQVPRMECGAENLRQKDLHRRRPVIVNANNCFANCPAQDVNLFEALVNVSTWTLPQSKSAVLCHFDLGIFFCRGNSF